MELKRLQQLRVIKPVTIAEWAAPIVPVMKRDEMDLSEYAVIINSL